MPPTKSRRSYTAAFKLQVVEYAEQNGGNLAAQREFGVSEKLVRDWRKQKDPLRMTKKNRKSFRTHAPYWPALEDQLEQYIIEQRAACRALNTVHIRMKALDIAKTLNITNFNGSTSWCFRFMKRKNLVIRQRTTVAQKLPADYQEKLHAFNTFVKDQITRNNIGNDNIINMDEVPLTFDIPMNRTVTEKGVDTVTVNTTGHEKASFTVVLACTASGKKLPPMVIFKRKTAIKEKLQSGVIVHNNVKGWMDNDVFDLWLSRCYVQRPGGFFRQKKCLLVLDSMRAHISDISKDRIKSTNSIPAVIPGCLTKLLQPLDISVNKSFKCEMRKLLEDWMCRGEKSFTETGRVRRASYPIVIQWVKDAWQAVTESTIINGFIKANIVDLPEIEEDQAMAVVSDVDDLPVAISALFHSDIEESDFEGFSDSDE